MLQEDGINTADWLKALSVLTAGACKKFSAHMGIQIICQYVANQLKDYSSFDLVVITDLIKSMSVRPPPRNARVQAAGDSLGESPDAAAEQRGAAKLAEIMGCSGAAHQSSSRGFDVGRIRRECFRIGLELKAWRSGVGARSHRFLFLLCSLIEHILALDECSGPRSSAKNPTAGCCS